MDVPGPSYSRGDLTTGVVHFGVGGFHRAHMAMYHDRLMNEGKALDWGICGVGVMEADARMRDALAAQDHRYTLVVKHSDGSWDARTIGSIAEYLYAPDDPEAVIEKLAAPETRIVSLTVTEGGYNLDDTTGEFVEDDPAVVHDLESGEPPKTVFGLVSEALARRRERGIDPFTVMSCDNLQGNGKLARGAFTAFARLRDPELGEWMERNVAFPNAMVDRITPATTEEDIEQVRERFGIDDRWPVVCEPFTQWVLEDAFGAGRPPYEDVGVQLVEDVEPYELMKLRLLNASHQAIAYFGHLCGYELVHDAAQDPLFRDLLARYMDDEATPTLAPVPGVDLPEYKRTLIERFSNPEVRDTVPRLAAESSDRIPKWLLPVVREQLKNGGDITRSAAIVASWARYAEGVDEHGEPIEIVDRRAEKLRELAREGGDAFIHNRELFGDLGQDERFAGAYRTALDSLHERGARATLEALASGDTA
jgi:mannitol 2-dehydrogenase